MVGQLTQRDEQRRKVLLALMLVTILGGVYFGLLNWGRGLYVAAVIELLFVAYCLSAWFWVRRTRRIRAWSLAMALPWMLAMLAIQSMPNAAVTVFIWVYVLPLLLYFLLGARLGLVLSLLGYLASAAIALRRFGLDATLEHMALAGNMVVAALALLLLTHVYERSRHQVETRLQRLAATDALTGLPNRNLLYRDFEQLKQAALRGKRPLSLMLIDLDHFKHINDRHGHEAGDRVLVAIGETIVQRLRGSDRAYRIGGEELLVLLPDTDLIQARMVAESLRESLAQTGIEAAGQELTVTASIGLAELGADGHALQEVLSHADQRMYWCKANGRNQVRAS
jgi:diguanylate cyclase (GGDEF)-like protein